MKRGLFLAFIMLVALGAVGCANLGRKAAGSSPYRPRAFALAVTVHGVLQPTPQQWAAIQAKVAAELAVHGWELVTDLALADSILRIDFTPNPNDPENSGHARLIEIRSNPRLAIASTTSVGRYPTSFSYLGTFQNASWGYGGFSNNYYYGWGHSYHDGYSYGSANLNPTDAPLAPPARPTHPPHRHNPGSREDCPSPADNYIRPRPDGWLHGYAAHVRGDHPRTPPTGERGRGREDGGQSHPSFSYTRSDRTPSWSEASTWRSDDAGSRAERTYSRAEPSPSRIERAHWRAGSSDSPRAERTYSRSEPSESRPERTYTRSESSRSWHNDASGSRSDSSSRPERSYSRSDSSGSGSGRTYSRSESSHSRSDSSHSRSEHSHSRSERSHSRSESRESAPPSPPPSSGSESSSSSGSSGATEPAAGAP